MRENIVRIFIFLLLELKLNYRLILRNSKNYTFCNKLLFIYLTILLLKRT
ncbi:unnamed protein product [Brugia timori]|uniref:Uncharacterized protein n=1 Tax=Brugia timori TaxID=42155 RepID=A0A3P7WAY2_9BILA|nr:unnamed protein product [Brugia timori]